MIFNINSDSIRPRRVSVSIQFKEYGESEDTLAKNKKK